MICVRGCLCAYVCVRVAYDDDDILYSRCLCEHYMRVRVKMVLKPGETFPSLWSLSGYDDHRAV